MTFFQSGPAKDEFYLAIRDRDSERCRQIRERIEVLWERFKVVADSEFRKRAKDYLHGQFWEMYLYATLVDRGLNVKRVSDMGLDFCIDLPGGRLWVEAAAP